MERKEFEISKLLYVGLMIAAFMFGIS